MPSVQVIVTFDVQPQSLSAFRNLLAQVRSELPSVPGCAAVRTLQSAASPTVFTLIEDWNSEHAHRRHHEQLQRSGAWDGIARHLSRPPESHYDVDLAA